MASVVQTGKFGPGNSDIQACKENPAKAKLMCSFGKVMYVAPSRLVSSTLLYVHALEGRDSSLGGVDRLSLIDDAFFPITCGSAFQDDS